MKAVPTAPFWMIYGMDQGAPTARHDCYEDAKHEAERLARHNPGVCFVILEAVEAIQKLEFHTARLRRHVEDDGLPF